MNGLFRLRPAFSGDARLIHGWRNEPAVRRVSFQQGSIPLRHHLAWYRKALANINTRIFVGENRQGFPIGYVRFQMTKPFARISVVVDPRFRGRGMGSSLIQHGCQRLQAEGETLGVLAQIRPDNRGSLKAFLRAGFSIPKRPRGGEVEAVCRFPLPRRKRHPRGVIFRTDGGSRFGLGHIRRCSALAAALSLKRLRCCFVVDGDEKAKRYLVRKKTRIFQAVAPFGSERDAEAVISLADRRDVGSVVVDSYNVNQHYLARLRAAGLFVVAIDDLNRFPFPCQMVIATGPSVSIEQFHSASGDTEFLLGSRFALLGTEFEKKTQRPRRASVRNLILTLGGADPHNLMPGLIRLADGISGDFSLDVVVGPFFKNGDQIYSAAVAARREVRIHSSPAALRPCFLKADVAISSAGQTLNELAASGTPTIAVQVAHNQKNNVQSFVGAGAVLFGGVAGRKGFLETVRRRLLSLMGDQRKRAALSGAGRRLIDGGGTRRVAALMASRLR